MHLHESDSILDAMLTDNGAPRTLEHHHTHKNASLILLVPKTY